MKNVIKICPICKNQYKHLLIHIRNYAHNDQRYEDILNQQIEIAKKLYYDTNYNTKSYNTYNLLLNYMDYAIIWYDILKLPKRKTKKFTTIKYITCPYCNKNLAQIALNKHLTTEHLNHYIEQVELAKKLFFDYNFSETTIDNYPDIYLNIGTINRIWRQTYTDDERAERSIQCNALHVSQVLNGKQLTVKHKENLSQAEVNYCKTDPNINTAKSAIKGFRPDIGHSANSTYEANIYRIFQRNNKKYKRETDNVFPVVFPDGSKHNYIIDICDINGLFDKPGTYIEVKGYMDERSLIKINCFKKQYPQYKLIIIGVKQKNYIPDIDYKQLEIKYQKQIPLWETTKDNIRVNPTKWNINKQPVKKSVDIKCPICGKIHNVKVYIHIKCFHKDLYEDLIYYINSLFYDIKFTKSSINQYRDKIYDISYSTIYSIWRKKYGNNVVSKRPQVLKNIREENKKNNK